LNDFSDPEETMGVASLDDFAWLLYFNVIIEPFSMVSCIINSTHFI
jgi:hypothetical protein